MKEETAIELLKIANSLAASVLSGDAATASKKVNAPNSLESCYKDCVAVVHDQFNALTSTAK